MADKGLNIVAAVTLQLTQEYKIAINYQHTVSFRMLITIPGRDERGGHVDLASAQHIESLEDWRKTLKAWRGDNCCP